MNVTEFLLYPEQEYNQRVIKELIREFLKGAALRAGRIIFLFFGRVSFRAPLAAKKREIDCVYSDAIFNILLELTKWEKKVKTNSLLPLLYYMKTKTQLQKIVKFLCSQIMSKI